MFSVLAPSEKQRNWFYRGFNISSASLRCRLAACVFQLITTAAICPRVLTGVLPFAGLPVLRFPALSVFLEPFHLGGFGDRNSNLCGDRTDSAECGLGRCRLGTSTVYRGSAAD